MSKRSRPVQAAQQPQMTDVEVSVREDIIAEGVKNLEAQDAFSNPSARIGFGSENMAEGAEYPLTRRTYNYMELLSLYRSSGIMRRIINKPAEDAAAHWVKLDTQISPEAMDAFAALERRTRIKRQILLGLKWGRLFGGAGGLIMIEGQGSPEALEQPLDLQTVEPDSFKGIYVVDRWSGIYPSTETENNISSPAFGLPEYYEIRTGEDAALSMRVHHSRVLRFPGEELPYWEKQVEQSWGASVIETTFEDLRRYDATLSNIEGLLYKADLMVQKTDMFSQMFGIGPQKMQANLIQTLGAQTVMHGNMRTKYIPKDDEIENFQYAFAGMDKVFEVFMYALSSATGIPVAILFGRSASGLDATGDADMDNYYTLLESTQEDKIRPLLDQLYPIMMMSEFGAVPDDLNFSFNSVRPKKDTDVATVAETKSQIIYQGYEAALLKKSTALKELRNMADETGLFSNITDEDIEQAEEEDENGGAPDMGELEQLAHTMEKKPDNESLSAQDADWDKNEHPRRDDGKFGEGKSEKSIDSEAEKQYTDVLLHTKTSDGVTIRKFSKHSLDRFRERQITPDHVKKVLQTAQPTPGHTKRTHVYADDRIRVVVDIVGGEIVTVMWRW